MSVTEDTLGAKVIGIMIHISFTDTSVRMMTYETVLIDRV